MKGLKCTHAKAWRMTWGYYCPTCLLSSKDGHAWGFYRQPIYNTAPIPEPKGHTANALRECVTNLALGKRVYYVVHELRFVWYCRDLLFHVAHLRGFPECRMKSETEFALKNGVAALKFISASDPDWEPRRGALRGRIGAIIFEDHHAWTGRRQ